MSADPDVQDYARWHDHFSVAAHREGWCLSACHGSSFGPWQVQHLDCAGDFAADVPQLDDDNHAWRIILEGRRPHHLAALAFVKKHNPKHYEEILVHANADPAKLDDAWKAEAVRAKLQWVPW